MCIRDSDDTDTINYVLCQNSHCTNYTFPTPNGDGRIKCAICDGRYTVANNLSLMDTLKKANLKTSNRQRHRNMLNVSRECDIILGTNDICSEGFSVESLNTLISLTPQQDVEQTVGRILRRQDSNTVNRPLIIDFIDRCGNFINHARVRSKIYENEGFSVVNIVPLNLDNSPIDTFRKDLFCHHARNGSYLQSNMGMNMGSALHNYDMIPQEESQLDIAEAGDDEENAKDDAKQTTCLI